MGKRFIRKLKYFFKRNAYAIAVSVCVLLVLTLVSVSALTFTSNNGSLEVDQEQENLTPNVPAGSDEVIVFKMPLENAKISKEYAEHHLLEDKTTGFWQTHQAIDFVASEGDKVLAVYDGTVEKVENSMMDGLVITIKHSDSLKSVYKCLSDESLVSVGDKVKAGQEIGKVATNLTEKADGIHLHFELYENEKLVDPTPYFSIGK